jgi:hypothetical protein
MKGSSEIVLNGKKVKLKFTLGVLVELQEITGDSDIDKSLGSLKNVPVV